MASPKSEPNGAGIRVEFGVGDGCDSKKAFAMSFNQTTSLTRTLWFDQTVSLDHGKSLEQVMTLDRGMTLDSIDRAGFAPRWERRRGSAMVAQLVATVALMLSIAVAATAVSIGIAHADGISATAQDHDAQAAVLLAFALVGMGGLMAFAIGDRAQSDMRTAGVPCPSMPVR